MQSGEYRNIIRKIVVNGVKKTYPGLKRTQEMHKLADLIARNVHARLYGANVDGVDSPLWQDDPPNLPKVDAAKLLKEECENV